MPQKEVQAFILDNYEDAWDEFTSRNQRLLRDKKWTEEFKDALKKLAGKAAELKLHGRKVAIMSPGQLNKMLLAKEQPDIIAKYTRTMVVERFDEDLFKKENPDMYAQYQAQRLMLVNEPRFDGLEPK